jgi:hypothetical protein
MRHVLTAAAAAALIAAMGSPAVAAPENETGTPSSNAAGTVPTATTRNTTADMVHLMDLGVDGIITDYPTRLRTLMGERGLKLPKAYEVKG